MKTIKYKQNNNLQIALEHGLNEEEYHKIIEILGREPNITELGIFSVMWSEHCSYKSTRIHLSKLHSNEEWVICPPGENAGIIDIGDGDAIAFKMESHNHPSYIEPYQGAATGVGGILRDVFTMGARPIAILDSLRFGNLNHSKTKHLLNGVSAGIAGYGNCVGVPNIAGDTIFHKSFNGNILVNAMCIGHVKSDRIFYSAASKIGASVVYVGSKTGRDGIHGATMASQEFDDQSEAKRPTVQVGDPFKEKLLIEACLELMQTDSIIAIQDMGAAGLTSSCLEMSGKGGTGIELNMDLVPVREKNMTAYEIMLSESQERMLMVIKPEKQELAKKIFNKWDLDCATIGKITDTKKLILTEKGEIVAEIPVAPLSDAAPKYDRPWVENKPLDKYNLTASDHINLSEALNKIILSPDISSKHCIYEQYDSAVMNDTVQSHLIASGIVRIHNSNKAIAATTDCTPRYVAANPFIGAAQAVIESYRNLIVLGAKPLAITNCLNFGNPEKPKVMGQIVKSIEGISDACKNLHFPVVSGNVSLYNETNGKEIQPTPNIGAVGLIDNLQTPIPNYFSSKNHDIFMIGNMIGELGSSLYLRECFNKETGDCPSIDYKEEIKNAKFIMKLIKKKLISAVNDISDGGLLTLLTKMSFPDNVGFHVSQPKYLNLHSIEFYFAEDQARYIITTRHNEEIMLLAKEENIILHHLGKTSNDMMIKFDQESVDLMSLKQKYRTIIDF